MGPIGSAALAFRGREVLEHLKRMGVRVSPGNRLEEAVKLTKALNQERILLDPADPDLSERVLESFRTIWDAYLILYAFSERRHKADLFPVEDLQQLVRGAPSARGEKDPKPRSTQLEMTTATKLSLGGADLRREEPDYTMLYHGDYLGLAIKRITKPRVSTLAEALKDATEQLDRYGKPGFAVLSLDPFLEDLDVSGTPADFGVQFNEQIREAHSLIARTPDVPHVMGVLVLGHDSGWEWEGNIPRLRWVEVTQFQRFSDDPAEVEKASEFFGPLSERMWGGLDRAVQLVGSSS